MSEKASGNRARSYIVNRVWSMRIVKILLVASLLTIAAPAQETGLFGAVRVSELDSGALGPLDSITLRRRLVTIDFDMLADARGELTRGQTSAGAVTGDDTTRAATPSLVIPLNLFDDTVFTAVFGRTAPTFSGYSLSGRIEEFDLATVTLVVNGKTVSGTVRTPQGTYRIRSSGVGAYVVSEVDLSRLPEGAEPLSPPASEEQPLTPGSVRDRVRTPR